MQWFYAEGKERCGPVDEAQFSQLVATGKIAPDTLVWKAGMANWQPFRTVAAATAPAAPPLPGHQRCIILGREFPESQMIQTEHGWVSGEGKDTYYQSLREGLAIPVHVGETNARRDGKKFVVPLANPKLPARCVKTNRPVGPSEQKQRDLYWVPQWIFLTILVSLLITLVLYLVLRKKVVMTVPMSRSAKTKLSLYNLLAVVMLVVGLFVAVGGFVNGSAIVGVLGVLLLVGGLVLSSLKGQGLRAVKLQNGEVWFSGAGPEFLASLPPYV